MTEEEKIQKCLEIKKILDPKNREDARTIYEHGPIEELLTKAGRRDLMEFYLELKKNRDGIYDYLVEAEINKKFSDDLKEIEESLKEDFNGK